MSLDFNEEYKNVMMKVYKNPSKKLFGKDVDFWLTKIAKQEYSDRDLVELVAERDSLCSLIKELVEDGERLANWPYPFTTPDDIENGPYCIHCHKSKKFGHDDDCAVALWHVLMKKVKEVFPITEEKRDASAPTGLSKEALLRIAEGTSGNLDHLGGINGG